MSHTNIKKRINSLNKLIICEGLINFKTVCHYMYVGSPCVTKLVVILLGMSCSLWHPLGLVKYGFWPLRIGLVPVHFVDAWLTDWSIGVWQGWMVCYVSWAVAELFLWPGYIVPLGEGSGHWGALLYGVLGYFECNSGEIGGMCQSKMCMNVQTKDFLVEHCIVVKLFPFSRHWFDFKITMLLLSTNKY